MDKLRTQDLTQDSGLTTPHSGLTTIEQTRTDVGQRREPQSTPTVFPFRPWVRRAGLSIVIVASAITVAIVAMLLGSRTARFGWFGERFVWVYIGTLWAGGLRVWLGTLRPVAEVTGETILLRPLHTMRPRTLRWEQVRGTEQMMGGDRMIVYFDTLKGMRFLALNLNLVKGRRELVTLIDQRLRSMGFIEKVVERSRYLSAP